MRYDKLVLVITFGRAICNKLPECIFKIFEIARVKRGQFQIFQKSQGLTMEIVKTYLARDIYF